MTYDTYEIRRAARKIESVSADVGDLSSGNMRRIKSNASTGLVGEAGDALTEQLNSLQSDLNSLSNGLHQIATALKRYAEALEEADRRAAEKIGSRG